MTGTHPMGHFAGFGIVQRRGGAAEKHLGELRKYGITEECQGAGSDEEGKQDQTGNRAAEVEKNTPNRH
jgi:hypothetical protein